MNKQMHDSSVIKEFESSYEELIAKGKDFCLNKNILITGIIRNGEETLVDNVETLQKIANLFNKSYLFFYENDSTDQTVNLLKGLSAQYDNISYKSEKLNTEHFGQSTSKTRTTNLAIARNHCIDYANTIKDDIDYVLVVDLDFLEYSIKGFLNSMGWISANEHISGIAGFSFLERTLPLPNGTATKNKHLTNYDSWAYRHTCWTDIYQIGWMYWFMYWIPVIGSPLLKVNSAFGGSCIYRKKYYVDSIYSGEDCEHVVLHNNMMRKHSEFQLYVNPSQIMYVDV